MLKIFHFAEYDRYFLRINNNNGVFYIQLPGVTPPTATELPSIHYKVYTNAQTYQTAFYTNSNLRHFLTPIDITRPQYRSSTKHFDYFLHAVAIIAELCQNPAFATPAVLSDLQESVELIIQWNQYLLLENVAHTQKQIELNTLAEQLQQKQLSPFFPRVTIDYESFWNRLSSGISERSKYQEHEDVLVKFTLETALGKLIIERTIAIRNIHSVLSGTLHTAEGEKKLSSLCEEMQKRHFGQMQYKHFIKLFCKTFYESYPKIKYWLEEKLVLPPLNSQPITHFQAELLKTAIKGDCDDFLRIVHDVAQYPCQLTLNDFMGILLILIYQNKKNYYNTTANFSAVKKKLIIKMFESFSQLTSDKETILYAVIFVATLTDSCQQDYFSQKINEKIDAELRKDKQINFKVDELPEGFTCNMACYLFYLDGINTYSLNITRALNFTLYINNNNIVNPALFMAILNQKNKLELLLNSLPTKYQTKDDPVEVLVIFFMILRTFPAGFKATWIEHFLKKHNDFLIDFLENQNLMDCKLYTPNLTAPINGVANLLTLKDDIDKLDFSLVSKKLQMFFYQDCQEQDIKTLFNYLYDNKLPKNIAFFSSLLQQDKFIDLFNNELKDKFLDVYCNKNIFSARDIVYFIKNASGEKTLTGCISLLQKIELFYDDSALAKVENNHLFKLISCSLIILSNFINGKPTKSYGVFFFDTIKSDLIDFLVFFNQSLHLEINFYKIINYLVNTQYNAMSNECRLPVNLMLNLGKESEHRLGKFLLNLSQNPALLVRNSQLDNSSPNKSGIYYIMQLLQIDTHVKLNQLINAIEKIQVLSGKLNDALNLFLAKTENLTVFKTRESDKCVKTLAIFLQEQQSHALKRKAEQDNMATPTTMKFRMLAPKTPDYQNSWRTESSGFSLCL